MKTKPQELNYISNGIMLLTAAAGFSFIGGLLTDVLFYIGLGIGVLFVILWSSNYYFNIFMDSKIKILTYMKYDMKNEPISYIGMLLCWIVVGGWFCRDMSQYGAVDFDVLMGVFSLYVVSCVMVFWGYTKEYDKLP